MKKLLSLLLVALCGVAVTARAENLSRAQLVERLDTCEAILQDLQASTKTAIPSEVLHQARGIVIINQLQGGFLFGVRDGYGVAMVRRPNGQWSIPVFIRAGELSLGLQVGVKTYNTVIVLMNDETTRLLLRNRVNFGAEAKAIAGIRGSEKEKLTSDFLAGTNALVYSIQEGFYVGAAVKTGFVQPNRAANQTFYDTTNRTPELLYSDWVTPPAETRFLINYVTKLTSQ